jgi:cytochrome c
MNRRHLAILSLTALLGLSPCLPTAAAEDRGTKEEAKAMVDAAFDHMKKVGADKALKDFTTDKAWAKKDLYVFVMDSKGFFTAHGANEKLVGRDMSNMKDPNGKAIFPAMMEQAAKGSGWVDYDWAHPQTKKVEGKSSYVRKTPSGDSVVGVGIYR